MRTTFIALAGGVVALPALLFAERARSSGDEGPREPAIPIVKAVELVMAYRKKSESGTKPAFVDEAVYLREDGGHWRVGLRLKAYESGHLRYKIDARGEVQPLPTVKDG